MNTNKTIVKNAKFAALSFLFAAAVSTTTFAADSNNPVKANNEAANAKAFNVKYLGSVEDGYIFNVSYDNLANENFDLIIKDETGETLYQRGFSGKNFSKKYQLSKSLIRAVVIIRPQHGNDQSFEVALQSRTTEDVVVTKL